MDKTNLKLLRYPGGKQRLLKFLLSYLPNKFEIEGRYIEPFVGGGAVFFAINPKRAIISDLNKELIDLYRTLRSRPSKVWKIFEAFPASRQNYYHIRDLHRFDTNEGKAARTLYLNRTCFKGMWRHNARGEFNVGYGGEDRRWAINKESLMEVSKRLKRTWIRKSDFESVINKSGPDDFIFLDPPYKPGEVKMSHAHYLHSQFTLKDHKRLAKSLHKATKRGVKWAMTTSSHPTILELFKKSNIIRVPKGTSNKLGILTNNSGEVLICNYERRIKIGHETIFYRGSFTESPPPYSHGFH